RRASRSVRRSPATVDLAPDRDGPPHDGRHRRSAPCARGAPPGRSQRRRSARRRRRRPIGTHLRSDGMIASLLNHLWQSTLFALLVALVVRALRDEAARIRYALWLAASLKFLVPFSLLTAVGARLAPLPERSIPEIAAWQTSFERLAEPLETAAFSGPLAATLLGVWIAGS